MPIAEQQPKQNFLSRRKMLKATAAALAGLAIAAVSLEKAFAVTPTPTPPKRKELKPPPGTPVSKSPVSPTVGEQKRELAETGKIPELDPRRITIAVVYGGSANLKASWGTLGPITRAQDAINKARWYAGLVDGWNGGAKTVLPCLNPALRAGNKGWGVVETWLKAVEQLPSPFPVMVDISSAEGDIEGKIKRAAGFRYGWVDIDCEFRRGGVKISDINTYARLFFETRKKNGFIDPAVFGFYTGYSPNSVVEDVPLKWNYGLRGLAVPIYDANGTPGAKAVGLARVLPSASYPGPIGTMEFVTKWGGRGDNGDPGLDRKKYLADTTRWSNDRLLIYACQ